LEEEKSIDGEELSQLEEELGEQRLRAAELKKKFEVASVEIKRMEQVVIDQFGSKSTGEEEPSAKLDDEAAVKPKSRDVHGRFTSPSRRDNQDYVQDLGMEAERIYEKWESAREKCSRLLKDHRNLLSAAQMRAKNRFADDSDAMTRMRVAMTALTNFMVRLLRKFPEAEKVARDMGASRVDPLAKGDLRQVFANLSNRYQREDNLGVVAFVVSKISENQASKSLGQLTRSMEEFMQYMHRLKVETVSVSDLTAMIQLAGMNEKQRLEFFRLEAQLALTGRIFDDNRDMKSVSGSVGSWSQGSLFDRLRLFAKSIDEVSLMSDKFKTQQPMSKPDASRNSREDKQLMSDNRNVFALAVAPGACFNFANYGQCRRGDTCRFSHSTEQLSSMNHPAGQDLKTGSGAMKGSSSTSGAIKGSSPTTGSIPRVQDNARISAGAAKLFNLSFEDIEREHERREALYGT
jgi:hypothetical protein